MQTITPPFFIAGGTVPSDAPCYVTRQADNDLFHALQNAEFCFVLDTRQVGKSSLMARVAERLRENEVRVALLDLTALGKESNPENWHYGLLELIGQELRCLKPLRAFWEANGGLPLTQRFMQAIEQVALEKEPTPLVLAIDEIDFVRSLPFDTDDFFAGIRECHNRRAHRPALKCLTFCLIGSATPNDLIQNVHITPFNVGRRVTITDFTEQEARPLADGLSGAGKDGKTLLAQILYWTNGHPYLTQRLCAEAAQSPEVSGAGDIDGLAKRLFLSRRASATEDVNLAFVRDRLLKSDLNKDKLFSLYQAVYDEKRAIADDPRDPYCNALRLSGIVAERDGYLFVRNRIYRELFTRAWAQEQMPGIEAAQHRREVRRARLQVAGVAGCIIAGMGGLAYNANQQYQRANTNAHKLQLALTDAENSRNSANKNAWKAREEAAESARQKKIADTQKTEADKQKAEADRQRELAERRKNEADKSKQKIVEFVDILGREKKKAKQEEEKAKQSAVAARQEADHAERFRYIANMNLIQRDYEVNNISNVASLLEQTRTSPYRGFEWGYWNRLCHLDLKTWKGHTGEVHSVAFSPDGTKIVIGNHDGLVEIRDARTGHNLLTLKGQLRGIECVTFSPDGTKIATGSADFAYAKAVKVWDAVTGRELFSLPTRLVAWSVTFSPDGKRIGTGTYDGLAQIWDANTGRELLTLKGYAKRGPGSTSVNSISFSPDGKRVATGSNDKTARVWDAVTGRELLTLQGHTNSIDAAAFSPDGRQLVTASEDNSVKVWDAQTGRELLTIKGHAHEVHSAAFSPDGKRIVTGSWDNTARVWDAVTGRELLTLKGHADHVNSAAFSPDGKRIVTGSDDNSVKVWDAQTEHEALTLIGHAKRVRSIVFSPNNNCIVTSSEDQSVEVWDTQTGRELLTLPVKDAITSFALSPDGKRIATCSDFSTVKLWDLHTGQEALTFKGVNKFNDPAAFSPDGKYFVTHGRSSDDTAVRVWDTATGRKIITCKGHADYVDSAVFSPDGKRIISSDGKSVKVWDAATGKEILNLKGHKSFGSFSFSPDARRIATSYDDKTVKVWDFQTGREFVTIPLQGKIYSVAFSPDGKQIVTRSDGKRVQVWDAMTGHELLTLKGHKGEVWSAAFSPDGKRIVTSGEDQTVKLWDAMTGRELLTFKEVYNFAISPDGKRIVTGSDDNTAKVWIGE